ncbi:MAG: SpoIID/LytB domain-containing protein [Solirubrobacteraceae bacterium]
MMRRIASALLLAGVFAAVPAGAASALTIRGAGFGHGVGMSQYGAAGFAEHGYTHAQILAHYFPGTEIGRVGTDTVVRVLLASPQTATFTGATNAGTVKLDPDQRYGARSASSGRVDLLDARGRVMATFDAPLRATNRADGPVTLLGTAGNGVRDGAYRGWLEFRPGAMGEVLAVNAVGLEQYVAGVIANEAIPSWPLEALESQAVASRGYALTTLRTEERGWDLYPDTRSQVYRGVTGENPNTNRAVNATAGEVVTYGGQPITTFYFSTSGGETENIENVWAGSPPKPYYVGVDDPYDDGSPYHRWGPIRLSRAQAQAKLGGLVKGSFVSIKVTKRGASPRVVKAAVIGTRGRTTVSGATLKARFGLRDTWMTFDSRSADVGGKPSPDPATAPLPGPDPPPTGGASVSR